MGDQSNRDPSGDQEEGQGTDFELTGSGTAQEPSDTSAETGTVRHRSILIAVWVMAILAAFLLGSTVVNIIVTHRALEGSKRQVEAISNLNESIKEVRKSIAELSKLIKELPDVQQEEEEAYQRPYVGDESI